jgi:competence protein ComFB
MVTFIKGVVQTMELYNTVKGKVIQKVNEIFESIKEEGQEKNYCTCNQCRMDVICYVLNRTPPYYIVSNRGASRTLKEGFEKQQETADISALVHEGLKKINNNMRPNFAHSSEEESAIVDPKVPKFNIPTIMGRVFNGSNFAPLSGVTVELIWNGELVEMQDGNWQNPFQIVEHIEGNFSFWPAPVISSKDNKHKIFDYILRLSAPDFETLTHIFKIPVASEILSPHSFSLDRTFKLPDLYMFPPGEAEKNGYIC